MSHHDGREPGQRQTVRKGVGVEEGAGVAEVCGGQSGLIRQLIRQLIRYLIR